MTHGNSYGKFTILAIIFGIFLSFNLQAAQNAAPKVAPKEKSAISQNSRNNMPTTTETSEMQMTPDAALQRLMEGNKRFMEDKSICPDRTQDRRAATVSKQKPFAIILGCSDSRVPPELAFDQGIGNIFVVRVAGNIVGDLGMDSIEYSVIYNNSAIIMVLGHKNCGAVDAILHDGVKDLDAIVAKIEPVIQNLQKTNPNPSLDQAIEANIRNSMQQVKSSAIIHKYMKEGKVKVVGAYYDLATGEVRLLD